jgi:hypothetical protein
MVRIRFTFKTGCDSREGHWPCEMRRMPVATDAGHEGHVRVGERTARGGTGGGAGPPGWLRQLAASRHGQGPGKGKGEGWCG